MTPPKLKLPLNLYVHGKHVEGHSMSILVHALKYYGGYETLALVDECAGVLIRKGQTFTIVSRFADADEGLNSNFIVRWVCAYDPLAHSVIQTN
jgi:hypothetical protein